MRERTAHCLALRSQCAGQSSAKAGRVSVYLGDDPRRWHAAYVSCVRAQLELGDSDFAEHSTDMAGGRGWGWCVRSACGEGRGVCVVLCPVEETSKLHHTYTVRQKHRRKTNTPTPSLQNPRMHID